MSRGKEVLTAVGTLTCALGIGFAMQNSEAAGYRYGETGTEINTSAPQVDDRVMVSVSDIKLTSAMPELDLDLLLPDAEKPATAQNLPAPVPPKQSDTAPETVAMVCDLDARAAAQPAAMVALSLTAACLPNAEVTIHHNGMYFTETLNEAGKLALTVPALSENAVFMVSYGDDQGVIAHTKVDDIARYKRVVLQWEGNAGFELHAREFGADYGAQGHVWRATDRGVDGLIKGQGGHVMALGARYVAEPAMAEVYTFPASLALRPGLIDLSIEAQVTADNCATRIDAETLEMRGTDGLRTRSVSMDVPDCAAQGDYLVLNNPLEDLKLAAR